MVLRSRFDLALHLRVLGSRRSEELKVIVACGCCRVGERSGRECYREIGWGDRNRDKELRSTGKRNEKRRESELGDQK